MRALLATALFLTLASCVSVDVTSSNPKTNRTLGTAQTTGKTVYNGWKAIDAIDDSIDKISSYDEIDVGQLAAISVISQTGDLVLDDEPLIRYLNSVGNYVGIQGERLARKPRTKGRRFWVHLLRSDEVNAFSTPGGNILLTTGLLERLNTESELAFVIGHEVAHIDYEHGLAALKTAVRADPAMQSVTELLLRKNKDKEPILNIFEDLGVFESFSYKVGDLLVDKKAWFLSPGQESEADVKAVEYLAKAGYEPGAGVRVLEVLREVKGAAPSTTHGDSAKRIATLTEAAKKHPVGKTGFARWQENGLARLEATSARAAADATPPPTP